MLGSQVLPKGNRRVLLLAIFFGLASAVLIYVYLSANKSDESGGQVGGPPQSVVVAAQDIPAGATITAEMVKVQLVPDSLVLDNSFQETENVVGKVAVQPVVAGEQVVASRVVAAEEAGEVLQADALAQVVPTEKESVACALPNCGLRAASVKVAPFTAAAGLIQPGDRVDIIAAFNDGSALTVITDVELLAIDQDFERAVGAEAEEEGEENPEAATATLALWPDEAQIVAAAEEMTEKSTTCRGSLRLTLRHVEQEGTFSTPVGQGFCAFAFGQTWGLAVSPAGALPEVEGVDVSQP